ncbi:MAG: hypothetical protein HAW62_00890 [Endozoicomonadaceae bacterium]|nr:hypothetical protein [Endozoicomonadaceae bacterium]
MSKHYSVKAIGKALQRSFSTIAREILYHTKGRQYNDQQTHQLV